MPITSVPARPGAVLPTSMKSATSLPLSPVIAKMVPGASSAYPQDTNGDPPQGSRGGNFFDAPVMGEFCQGVENEHLLGSYRGGSRMR